MLCLAPAATAEATRALRASRREFMQSNGWSLLDLYRTLETPGTNRLRDAYTALDTAARAAYSMKEKEDLLAFLLALNVGLAQEEAKGRCITPPGLPAGLSGPAGFVSENCVTCGQPPT